MKIRIYLEQNFTIGENIFLDKNNSHYLSKVLRLKENDEIYIFNNKQGEYLALFQDKNYLKVIEKTNDFDKKSNISLAFAPVKNVKTDFIITKAVELGIDHIYPLQTQHTIIDKVNISKAELNIIESSKQCRRNRLANIEPLTSLKTFLNSLDTQIVVFCNEKEQDNFFHNEIYKKDQEHIILIGPEGGFSDGERNLIKSYNNSFSVSLGKNILKADTAIISSLSLANHFLTTK